MMFEYPPQTSLPLIVLGSVYLQNELHNFINFQSIGQTSDKFHLHFVLDP